MDIATTKQKLYEFMHALEELEKSGYEFDHVTLVANDIPLRMILDTILEILKSVE